MAPLAHRKPGILILVGAVALAGAGLASTSPSSFAPWSALDAAETLLASAPGEGTGSMAPQQANVELARQLLQASNQETDDLRRGVLLAQISTMGQARALGLPWADPPRVETHASPSEAVLALLAAHDAAPSAPQRSDIAALDALPEPARGALARFVDAFLAMESAALAVFEPLEGSVVWSPAEAGWSLALRESPAASRAPWLEAPEGMAALLATRNAFLEATLDVNDALTGFPRPQEHDPLPSVRVPPVLFLELAGRDTLHGDEMILTLDLGGNDLYYNNAGGSNLAWGSCRFPGMTAAAALVDLAGNDQFGLGRSCGANGGGYAGAGFLLDANGDDRYVARSGGVNGGGFAGTGFLLDVAGHDVYTGESFGANGGGVAGVLPGGAILAGAGMLIDLGGADEYSAIDGGVNGGGFFGGGALIEGGGSDVYRAGSFGTNGGGSFGEGFLLDLEGTDAYAAGGTATNGGSRAGSGFLFDVLGNDFYTATSIGVNGGVSSAGVALLLDGAGTDRYQQGSSVCQNPASCSVVPKGLAGAQLDVAGGL